MICAASDSVYADMFLIISTEREREQCVLSGSRLGVL